MLTNTLLRLSRSFAAASLSIGSILFSHIATAQGSTDHLPGKIYVIRMSPFMADSAALEQALVDKVLPVLEKPMFAHIRANLHRMRSASEGKWFVGYFHPDRQDRDVLLRDNDLLTWLLHGHDVQIMPIELVRSPIEVPLIASPHK